MAETSDKTAQNRASKDGADHAVDAGEAKASAGSGEQPGAAQPGPANQARSAAVQPLHGEGGNPPASLAQRRAIAARRQAAQLRAASNPGSPPAAAPGVQPGAQPHAPHAPSDGPAPRPVAAMARPKAHHWGLLASFLALVCLPAIGAATYLWGVAVNQYSSTVGFAVRTEQMKSSLDILGGLSMLAGGGGSSSSDMNILYKYIQSQDLVAAVDEKLDLRAKWSPPYKHDPYFALNPDSKIEDLTAYWQNMVILSYDSGAGLLELTVKAFKPDDAKQIAEAIFNASSTLVNHLSAIAREDATRYARQELEQAKDRLKGTRKALTAFRMKTRIIDPTADIQGQMGLLTSLQSELAQSLIKLDLLHQTARPDDPRISQEERKIKVIRKRGNDERNRFSADGTGPSGENYATLVANYEQLSAEKDFAEKAYTSALASYDGAVSQAQQQSRYLATYIQPTLAQQSLYPQRKTILLVLIAFLLLGWAIGALIYYSIRDRR